MARTPLLVGCARACSCSCGCGLLQVGPRLELEIVKVEEGLCDGHVLFHKYEQRTSEEQLAQQKEWDDKAALREQRRRQQVRKASERVRPLLGTTNNALRR